jgi:uncharacterized protein (UPF0303 family)/catechol 2,3-dioxygenase-like lactoylglutathione lyase family enzyme
VTDDEALLARLADEEARIVLDRFTNGDALELGLALVAAARTEAAPVVVDIRRGAQQLFHVALAGTSADNDQWVIRKARVVERFGHSSWYMGAWCRTKGGTLAGLFGVDDQEFAAHGGSFPLTIRDVGVVGAVTVSGLPQADDHRLVVATLEAFAARSDGVQVEAFDHLVLRCADVDRSLAWYTSELGLAPVRVDAWRAGEAPFPSARIDAGTIIDFIPGEAGGRNVDHVCLVVDAGSLDRVASSGRFEIVGGPASLFGARGVATGIYVHDPDDNVVELRAYP